MALNYRYSAAVIGANGFLGRALINTLYNNNIKVLAVFNKNKGSIPDHIDSISINDFGDQLFEIEKIFFLAGNFKSTQSELITLHCEILRNILIKYPNSKHIFISSTNVFGNPSSIISNETPFCNPTNYGLAKLLGEFIVSSSKFYSIVRLTYVYGNYLANNSFLPNLINQAKIEKEIVLFGDGKREQDYLHVSDAVNLCLAAADSVINDIYIGATGISYSNKYIAELVASQIKNCKIVYKEGNSGHSYKFDPSDTFIKLKWNPQVSIDTGIKNMISCVI